MRRVNYCAALSETALPNISHKPSEKTAYARDYANQLLADLGCYQRVDDLADHPALAWRRSGLLQVTGLMLPAALASHADGALMAMKILSRHSDKFPKNGSLILGERARLRNLIRKGPFSASGYGQILNTKDDRIALNLVREEDWDLVPAWLEQPAETWDDISKVIRNRSASDLMPRAAEMGLAVGLDTLPIKPKTWFSAKKFQQGHITDAPLIVDLSGLWAAPLASSILSMTGAHVVKIESPARPDGMRFGHEGFYNLINAAKDCVALDFQNPNDVAQLKTLLEKADIVIEASRPRALEQLGINALDYVSAKAGKIWARLTAYGRGQNRIGFGDDISVSAGLTSLLDKAHGVPCFAGDAIADPVTGLHLALAIQASLGQGGGVIIDMSMCDVLRYAIGDIESDLPKTTQNWQHIADKDKAEFYKMRTPYDKAKAIGADNTKWLC